jgi:hypothetical protein
MSPNQHPDSDQKIVALHEGLEVISPEWQLEKYAVTPQEYAYNPSPTVSPSDIPTESPKESSRNLSSENRLMASTGINQKWRGRWRTILIVVAVIVLVIVAGVVGAVVGLRSRNTKAPSNVADSPSSQG